MTRHELECAIRDAILRGESAYMYMTHDETRSLGMAVTLPSPQTSGTYTQQRTYATLEARKLADEIENTPLPSSRQWD